MTSSCKPELKRWDCTDYDPIESWDPSTEEVVYWLALHIGQPEEEAADLFYVPVATHQGLKSALWRDRVPTTKTTPIVVGPYSWEAVLREVKRRVMECAADDWHTVWTRLRDTFDWEFRERNPPG